MPKILNDPKENMLKEVERLLKEEGYAAVTIRSVAQGCGLGVGTVYNYFPSKEAMLAEYLLTDWRECLEAIREAGREPSGVEAVARCICRELNRFAGEHMTVFTDENARTSFAGSFSPYHKLLRSQLAQPLRPFCRSDFAAEFTAEALLTWTMAGKEFSQLWELVEGIVK